MKMEEVIKGINNVLKEKGFYVNFDTSYSFHLKESEVIDHLKKTCSDNNLKLIKSHSLADNHPSLGDSFEKFKWHIFQKK